MTKLQEARARVREAEEARIALAAKHAAQDASVAPAKARLERIEAAGKRAPIVVVTAGQTTIQPGGVPSLGGYGWSSKLRDAMGEATGKAAQQRATEAILNGAVGVEVGGAVSKCKGLAKRMRFVQPPDMRKIKVAHDKVVKAENVLRVAQNVRREAVAVAYANGGTIAPEVLASMLAEHFIAGRAGRVPDQWQRDRDIRDARTVCEAADAHLAHVLSKSTEPCACPTCVSDRRDAEHAAETLERQKKAAKIAAAAQKTKDRAPWREYTCPSCGEVSVSQVLPKMTWDNAPNPDAPLYLRCTKDRCHWPSAVNAVRSKPAKKPEAVAA